jgi:hypothetical protein
MIDVINRISEFIVTGINRLFGWLPPIGVLLVHGLLMGVLALSVYALVSNQASIKRTKSRLLARVLEIRLFQDDPLAVIGSFFRVLGGTFLYMKDSLMPLVVMLPIVVLWITQLAGFYEWRPLRAGETTVVAVKMEKGTDISSGTPKLSVPAGMTVETEAFRSLKDNEVVWRVKADAAATGTLKIDVAGESAEKEVAAASGGLVQVSPKRLKTGFWEKVYYPYEASLPADKKFSEIRVTYPQGQIKIFGIEMNWLIILLIASILFGFALKKPFKVEF